MQRFDYTVLSADGSVLSGSLRAGSEREAARALERKGLTPLQLSLHAASARQLQRRRLQDSDLILAFHQLATMLQAGVTLVEAVEAQAATAEHPKLAEAFAGIAAGLRRGESFHDALDKARLPLPPYLPQLVRAGELTGRVGESLQDGVAQMEFEHGLRTEMRNALIYPSILVLAGIAAVVLMFAFVVPKFSSLLERADELPWLAWAVLSGGTFANAWWPWLLALFGVGGLWLWHRLRSESTRLAWLQRLSTVPVLGEWLTEADTARWAKVMATLLGHRVPLIQALELAANGTRLPQRRDRLAQAARAVRGGSTLADALEEQSALNPTGYNLVRVGERSGELPGMLQSLARLYEEAGRTRLKRLLILIEPLAILIIGAVIGTIILGVILAITSANDLAV